MAKVLTQQNIEANKSSQEQLKRFIERVERLDEERKALNEDINEVFNEAKNVGYDVKVMKKLLMIRKMDPAELEEQEALLEIYRKAVGN